VNLELPAGYNPRTLAWAAALRRDPTYAHASARALAAMLMNHIRRQGFSYTVAPGAYGWNGGFGTSWFNDPANGLTAVLLTQRVFDSADPPQLHKDFWRAAYATTA